MKMAYGSSISKLKYSGIDWRQTMAVLPEVRKDYGKLRLLIGGEWVDSQTPTVNQTVNPANGEIIAEFPTATRQEARAAVEAARQGFEALKKIALRERARMLFDMRQKFEEHFDELTRVLTQDHGRTIGESRGSVRRCIENIESACSAAYGMAARNEHIDQLASGIDMWMTWEPLGAFLIVTPGNIPMHAWSSFVPYALAAGCSVVISPSRQDPVAAEFVNRVALEAGWPKGAINMIHGGRAINNMFLNSLKSRDWHSLDPRRPARIYSSFVGNWEKTPPSTGTAKTRWSSCPTPTLKQSCLSSAKAASA